MVKVEKTTFRKLDNGDLFVWINSVFVKKGFPDKDIKQKIKFGVDSLYLYVNTGIAYTFESIRQKDLKVLKIIV